jgi:GT2 family glycosyltransferase
MNKTVTIGIPTYNRRDLLQIMAASLYESDLSTNHHIRIYDDGSTEYNACELREMFPTAVSVVRNKVNIKADKNIYQIYYDFVKQGGGGDIFLRRF